MSKLTAAYLAGLIDGEGYIGIQKQTRKHNIDGYGYMGVLKICMTDKYLIKWLSDSFGGYFGERIGKDGRKDSYEWCLRHERNVKPVLDKVFPYLKVKRKQAEVLKKFFGTFNPNAYKIVKNRLGNNGTGYHKELKTEIKEYREKLYLELKQLKKTTQWQPERLNSEPQQGK